MIIMAIMKDVKLYEVLELDLWRLRERILDNKINEVIVYGVGNNGDEVFQLLKSMNIAIKYFVDIKGRKESFLFNKISVISPEKMLDQYDGEYIIITPSIHDAIMQWLEHNGIPKDKMILEFLKTEDIEIDYAGHYGNVPSDDVRWCKSKPKNIKGTFFTIAYNTPEKLFRRAIESVLNQTDHNFLYLIIVNGATDKTSLIAREYAALDARIRLYELEDNLKWTDPHLLNLLKNNIDGMYCCQLDSDDYYDRSFFEETLKIGCENKADVVCVRTCLFSADSDYNPMEDGFLYDWHDKFFFNIVHPRCHYIGHKNIMKAYSRSEICSTFWGKLYSNKLMERYLDYILALSKNDRDLYYRLDIAMTYRILSFSERVFFSDKPLHFSQYSGTNSTYVLAPIEWLMSLWYSYKGIKQNNYLFFENKYAFKYCRDFLRIHLPWMVNRKGMLKNFDNWENRDKVIEILSEMLHDSIFIDVMLKHRKTMRQECYEFYRTMEKIVKKNTY